MEKKYYARMVLILGFVHRLVITAIVDSAVGGGYCHVCYKKWLIVAGVNPAWGCCTSL